MNVAQVPWLLVAVHMLLACLVWVATLKLHLSLRSRGADLTPPTRSGPSRAEARGAPGTRAQRPR